jgi:antimicrobial peptide system SdpA family protein
MKKYKFILTYLLLSFISILLIFFIVASSLPYNSMDSNFGSKLYFNYLPQGWGFFTRSPREAQIQFFYQKDNNWLKMEQNHASYKNIFGAKKGATKLMMEMQNVFIKIKEDKFINTKSDIQASKLVDIPVESNEVSNDFDNPILCGEYLIVCQELVPWAWAKSNKSILMPSKVAKVNILCKN